MSAPNDGHDELGAIVDRVAREHAARAAEFVLAIAVTRDPQLRVTAELHAATAALVLAVAALATSGGAR